MEYSTFLIRKIAFRYCSEHVFIYPLVLYLYQITILYMLLLE